MCRHVHRMRVGRCTSPQRFRMHIKDVGIYMLTHQESSHHPLHQRGVPAADSRHLSDSPEPSCLFAGHRAWSSLPVAEPQEPQLPPFDHTPAPYEGPSREEVYALRKQYLSPGQCAPQSVVLCNLTQYAITMLPMCWYSTAATDIWGFPCSPVPPLQAAHHDHGGEDAVLV